MRRNLFLFSWLLLVVGVSPAASAQTRTHRAVGVVQTGLNMRCGAQVWALDGLAAGVASSGTFMGKKNASIGATEALPISPADCDPVTGDLNALLATSYDDAFGAFRGWVVPNVNLENRTFRSIPIPAGNGVRAPIPFQGSVPPNPLPPTIAEPTSSVTLGSWLAASGDLEIVCDDSTNTATIAVKMSNLVENGVYTMWSQWTEGIELLGVPLGGLPNTIVADEGGNAEFCRSVQYCPLDLAPDSSTVQFMTAVYMGDGVSYGGVPYEAFTTRAFVGIASLPFASSIPGGIVSFDHLGFRINATGGPDPGPTSPMMCAGPPATAASMTPWGVGLIFALIAAGSSSLLKGSARRGVDL